MSYKLYAVLFLIFMILQSHMFIENVLIKFEGAVEGTHTITQYGKIIQGIVLIITYAGIITLIDNEYL